MWRRNRARLETALATVDETGFTGVVGLCYLTVRACSIGTVWPVVTMKKGRLRRNLVVCLRTQSKINPSVRVIRSSTELRRPPQYLLASSASLLGSLQTACTSGRSLVNFKLSRLAHRSACLCGAPHIHFSRLTLLAKTPCFSIRYACRSLQDEFK